MRATSKMDVLKRYVIVKKISMRNVRGRYYHKLSTTRNLSPVCSSTVPCSVPGSCLISLRGAFSSTNFMQSNMTFLGDVLQARIPLNGLKSAGLDTTVP